MPPPSAIMTARVVTEPIMDSLPPHERYGPQVYVHVEFGVSWTKKPPKNHEVTYRSRGLRERTPHFPREVPAPNTNYLAAIHDFEQRQTRARQTRHHLRPHPDAAYAHHQMQEYYCVPAPSSGPSYQPATREQHRLSRGETRQSHERGRSAPPPIGDNPWDVNFSRRQDGGAATPMNPPDPWKALPAEPSQFRLGEGGQPWSAWSWPFEYHPDTPGREEEESMSVKSDPAREGREYLTSAYATSPTMVSVFSPGPSNLEPRHDETGRARELGALSAAMMTVDNGFENQWWNQGEREVVPADEPAPGEVHSQALAASAGPGEWSTPNAPSDGARSSLATASIVSPMTASAEMSPQPAFQSLHRSLSTRSEELFFSDMRR